MTTITALPTAPSRADPANFRTRADAFMAALPTFATETNTVAGEVNTNASNAATSASTASARCGSNRLYLARLADSCARSPVITSVRAWLNRRWLRIAAAHTSIFR